MIEWIEWMIGGSPIGCISDSTFSNESCDDSGMPNLLISTVDSHTTRNGVNDFCTAILNHRVQQVSTITL